MQFMLKAPGTQRLKLDFNECFQFCLNFAFKSNFRRYNMGPRLRVSKPRLLSMLTHFRRVEAALLGCRGGAVQIAPIKPTLKGAGI
jgi:hypothetical protein